MERVWSDNAATVDLLGYEDLLIEIVELALDETLQPLTIGAFADWGAGKSTLLNLAGTALRAKGALVVEFSPWLVEGYDDMKACLLGAVIDSIESNPARGTQEWPERPTKLLRNLRSRINWLRLAKSGASIIGSAAGASSTMPEIAAAATIIPVAAAGVEHLRTLLKPDDLVGTPTFAGSAEVSRGFHSEFAELLEANEDIRPLVVLIDDLDRCLPDQVIETLEAIRLFLSAPGTAFVIAADERLVRDAVRHRYSVETQTEVDLPREYLEKLVHVAMRIPPLTRPETESYCNLLVAQRLLSPEGFEVVLESAQRIRRSGELQVSCNLGIVREALSEGLPARLETEFGLIEQMIGPLATGLKGNPRQIKRYLNTFNIRRRTAKRRGIKIDEAVLAKLVVLEYVRDDRHRQLHTWQQLGGGLSEELARLEEALDSPSAVQPDEAIGSWAADQWTQDWLAAEPQLTGVDLTPYFFLSRDRVSDGGASSQLPPKLQVLVAGIGSETASVREPAVDEARELAHEQQLLLVEASAKRLRALPDKQPMMKSMIEIAAAQPPLLWFVIKELGGVPFTKIPLDIPLLVAQHLSDSGSAVDLLDTWERQDASGRLSKAALQARRRIGAPDGNV